MQMQVVCVTGLGRTVVQHTLCSWYACRCSWCVLLVWGGQWYSIHSVVGIQTTDCSWCVLLVWGGQWYSIHSVVGIQTTDCSWCVLLVWGGQWYSIHSVAGMHADAVGVCYWFGEDSGTAYTL